MLRTLVHLPGVLISDPSKVPSLMLKQQVFVTASREPREITTKLDNEHVNALNEGTPSK